jgi:hypothetical protein
VVYGHLTELNGKFKLRLPQIPISERITTLAPAFVMCFPHHTDTVISAASWCWWQVPARRIQRRSGRLQEALAGFAGA